MPKHLQVAEGPLQRKVLITIQKLIISELVFYPENQTLNVCITCMFV